MWAHAPAQAGRTTALRAEANSREGVGVLAINHGGGLAAHFQGDVRMDGSIFLNEQLLCFLSARDHDLTLNREGRGKVDLYDRSMVNLIVMPIGQPMPNLHYYLSVDQHQTQEEQLQPEYVRRATLNVEGGAANGLVKATVLYYLCPGRRQPQ